MGKLLGIALVLALLCGLLAATESSFTTGRNLVNLTRQTAFLGIYSMGAGIVIIAGGIDLSVGSLMALVGILLAMSLSEWGWPIPAALALCMGVSCLLGWAHGFLVTRARLQPFVVTLCALLIYRGAARFLAEDATKGFGTEFPVLKLAANGSWLGLPIPLWLMFVVALVLTFLVHFSVFGRHLFALGGNEQAARYSGVPVAKAKRKAYALAGALTGFAAILVALYVNGVQPGGHGQFFELYAIAAAVLGGCSLRGGEGSIPGILLGAALIRVLWNGVSLWGIPPYLEFAVIGGVILFGAVADELIRGRLKSRV
jgi:ribose transport system permease protein